MFTAAGVCSDTAVNKATMRWWAALKMNEISKICMVENFKNQMFGILKFVYLELLRMLKYINIDIYIENMSSVQPYT